MKKKNVIILVSVVVAVAAAAAAVAAVLLRCKKCNDELCVCQDGAADGECCECECTQADETADQIQEN